jgi:hypothetical protein
MAEREQSMWGEGNRAHYIDGNREPYKSGTRHAMSRMCRLL